MGRNILMAHIIIPNQDTECCNVASWVLSEFKPWGNSTEVIGIIFTHISNKADVSGHDVFGLSHQDIHNHRRLVENFNDLSVSIVDGFSSSKEFLGIESYALTRLGSEKVEACGHLGPHDSCHFNKSLYEPSTHTVCVSSHLSFISHTKDRNRIYFSVLSSEICMFGYVMNT